MKNTIFYVLRGEFYRTKLDTNNLVKIYKTFASHNPIHARFAAFQSFHDYIELLYLAKNKRYTNYKQAVTDLQDFFNSYSLDDILTGNDSDTFRGISLSLVIDPRVEFVSSERITYYNDEIEIHGFSKNSNDFSIQRQYFNNLRREAEIYKQRGIPTGVNIAKYDISPLFEDPEIIEILPSPINFNDMISDLLIMGERV